MKSSELSNTEKVYEPWIIGFNKVPMYLGLYQTVKKAQEVLDLFVKEYFTAST